VHAATQQQRFEHDLRTVFDEGDGAMTLTVLTAATSVALVANAMSGDASAKNALSAADRLLRRIHRRAQRNALACMICDDSNTLAW
jgi:hypothetical protein